MNQALQKIPGFAAGPDVTGPARRYDNDLESVPALSDIEVLDGQLFRRFRDRLQVEPSLTRALVSFQASKTRTAYRWYKYKEAFSASLVDYLLRRYRISSGKVLDPFAGIGTTLFAASEASLNADGIELLPIGQQVITARLCLERKFTKADFATLRRWLKESPWKQSDEKISLPKLRITDGAYPTQTVEAIERYIGACQQENSRVRTVLRFVLLCVLESVSFTRKDGQYLRWDHRSGRKQGAKPFDKGPILDFDRAIRAKLEEIIFDLQTGGKHTDLFPSVKAQGHVHLFPGSCLNILPTLPDNTYDAVITSPPYCNRYDYTRTYALELALLGVGERELVDLRQQMLSCTVENRAKDLLKVNSRWADAIAVTDRQELLQTLLRYLEDQKAQGKLNNNGIPRMARGYFYEMACVIAECARVLKPGAPMFMVNDNVRYAGASISVDMILSNIAGKLGFRVENILVLPNGKGNSSQQMGEHGRDPLRKCVYVWRKASDTSTKYISFSYAQSLKDELRAFREFGTATRVTVTEARAGAGEPHRVETFVNEFWTAKQRAAHSLHEVSYRACFKPQLPRFFIERLTRPGETVYDPFMGRGTTLLEAALLGRIPAGCDVNPLSAVLTQPRLEPPTMEEVTERLGEIDFGDGEECPEDLLVFYHPETLREICALRKYLLRREAEGRLDGVDRWVRMVAVNRLTGHSPGFFSVYTMPPNQAVSAASQRKINERRGQVPPRRNVPGLILAKSRALLSDCDEETRRTLSATGKRALLLTQPAARTPQIPDGSVALVVTSPPFLDVVDYAGDNWLRCWFCGIDPQAVPLTIPKRVEAWQAAMAEVFVELRRVLKRGGHVAFEVGEVRGGRVKLEEVVIPCGAEAGLEPVLALIHDQRFTKTANCWGVDNGRKGTNTNRVVVFRK